jgi:hypothetical protein
MKTVQQLMDEMSGDQLDDHASVLRRQATIYRAAADHYEIGAQQLRRMADDIEARNYKAEAPPPGWMARSRDDNPWRQPEPEPEPLDYNPTLESDALVPARMAAANDISSMDELYVGTLEDKGFTYEQCEEISKYFQEIIGAYKLEFDWGCSVWVDGDRSVSRNGFSYTDFKYDDDDMTVWWMEPPVTIRFGIDDMRRAVRQYVTSYDDTKDGSEIEVRRELLDILGLWCDHINTLIIEIEGELK